MIRPYIGLLIMFCSSFVLNAQDKPADNPAQKWENDIRQFEQWDSKNTFPSEAVLFVGSSSIRLWPTRECFGEFPVLNRGFGGSQISDVNYFAGRIVLPYRPKVIVFYAGDNDIAAGKGASQVYDDYKKFAGLVHEKLPATRIVYIGIKPSRSRWSLWEVMNEANMKIKALSEKDDRLHYFDSATPLLSSDGIPNVEFFLKDQLHLNEKGYEAWTRQLKPIVEKAFNADKKNR